MALTIPPEPKTYSPDIPPPGVRKDYVSFVATRKIITPRLHLIHTNGAANQGSIESSKAWAERRTYNGTTTTLPTFQVDRDGDAAMFIPMNRAQNACYKVNGWAISCETADTGYKADPTISAFTEPQMQVLANISAYASMLFKIPLAYPATWDGSGTASHTEPFAYPYWTNSNGKICPGNKKKAQVRDVILPWAREIVATWTSQPAPTPIPPTTPPPPVTGGMERMLIAKYGGTPTANWAGWYSHDGGKTRVAVKSMTHANLLVALGALDGRTKARVTDPNWGGVSHTTSSTTLDSWLTPFK